MKRRIAGALALVVAAGLAISAVVAYAGWRSLDAPVALPAKGYVLEIAPGTPFALVARHLHEEGYLPQQHALRVYARLSGLAPRIKAGEYLLEPPMSARALLDRLVEGRTLLHAVTFVEGWTFEQLLVALAAHPAIEHTIGSRMPAQIMAELGEPDADPEGRFFPDTYRFERGTRDLTILAQAHAAMTERLATEWAERASGLPFDTAYEALTLASLVERETSLDAERARIAGVFVKRLRVGMRLQSDPTVIYGMGASYDGNLRVRDLQADTAYNTYTRTGLPPTPIAMPGAASLRAAVRPEESEALYFVATGDGGHHFSATLEEHSRAVQRYVRSLRGGARQQ